MNDKQRKSLHAFYNILISLKIHDIKNPYHFSAIKHGNFLTAYLKQYIEREQMKDPYRRHQSALYFIDLLRRLKLIETSQQNYQFNKWYPTLLK